jgi:hypothetical protein
MDNGFDDGESEAFSVCLLPLSDVLEASPGVTDDNIISFNSTESTEPDYIYPGGKSYLAVTRRAAMAYPFTNPEVILYEYSSTRVLVESEHWTRHSRAS